MLERHISNIGIVLLRLDPLVAETLQHVDEAGGIMHLTLVSGQLDSELVLVIAQGEFTTNIKGLFHDHPTFILLTDAHLMAEEFQTTENRFLLVADIR